MSASFYYHESGRFSEPLTELVSLSFNSSCLMHPMTFQKRVAWTLKMVSAMFAEKL